MSADTLYRAASKFVELGICVIPICPSNKMPPKRFMWKVFQQRLPDRLELRDWFLDADPEQIGIGIVCGAVSDGLAVADFDKPGSYERWATAHPDLARELPTVVTGRPGRHVYFRTAGVRSCKAPFGDVKGEGGYVVAPPSLHPRGVRYRWEIRLAELPPLIDPVTASFLRTHQDVSHVTHRDKSPCVTPSLSLPVELAIERAILKSMPRGEGERHDKLFAFIRRLKAIRECAGREDGEMELIVRRWHAAALPFIGTKPFAETWREFVDGWGREVRKVILPGDLDWALIRATQIGAPPEADHFPSPTLRLLAAICRVLAAEHPNRVFFLACRDAARLLGLIGEQSHVAAWRMLGTLCAKGLLEHISSGSYAERRANQYRYLGRP